MEHQHESVPLSSHCARGMHGFCQLGMAGCGCAECHHLCTRCLRETRKLYGDSVCPACYTAELKATPTTRCEHDGCSATHAYRDPRYGPEYLCVKHHAERGRRVVSTL